MSYLPHITEVEIVLLLASPVHRYEGRPSDGPLPANGEEGRSSIRLRAGLGIVGDRFFAQPAHRHGSVTLLDVDVLERVADDLGVPRTLDPLATRRNILVRGVDVDAMRGAAFSLDSGDGPVEFFAHRPANPCAWMDVVLAPGAHRALRGRGGMRCEPLTDGTLRVGPARLLSSIRPGTGAGVTGAEPPGRPVRPGSPPESSDR